MSLSYRDNKLFLGSHDLQEIMVGEEGRACYVYDLKNVSERYKKLTESLRGVKNLQVHYAMKANANGELLKHMKGLGARVDVVSAGEMQIAMDSGFDSKDVIFSGVAKSVSEINRAMDAGIKQINVESSQELIRIAELAQARGRKMPVALRMNPEVSPVTHPYITTGMSENKFGMDQSFIPELVRILKQYPEALHLRGLTMHIGSQLLENDAMGEAVRKLRAIFRDFQVLGFELESLDIGGGVGIHYDKMDETEDFKHIEAYGQIVCEELGDFQGEVIIEPGRVLVGRCGVLLCQIEYIKTTPYKNFAIVNTGMHHIMRPALYQATHRIIPLLKNESSEKKVYDIVGPICESSDFLGKNRPLQELNQGDYMAICDAGAYGFSMANNYNAHDFPKEIVLSE